jgi:hypothetical protein
MPKSKLPSQARGPNCQSSTKQASLQVGNKSKERYLIVITDKKGDLDNFTLKKHHQQTRDRMLQKMKNASATEPVSHTIEGHGALQDELTGTKNGTNVVFLHTTLDDGDHFQQILGWTLNPAGKNRMNCCAKSPRVSGAKSNVVTRSVREGNPSDAPAQNHVWLASASIVFHSSAVS